MPYAIITVFDQTPFSNDTLLDAAAARKIRTAAASNITLSEKSSGNDKYGTGSLVTREGAAALERGRGRLYKLVRAHGPGKPPARKRPPFGSDAVSQELDPGALRR